MEASGGKSASQKKEADPVILPVKAGEDNVNNKQ